VLLLLTSIHLLFLLRINHKTLKVRRHGSGCSPWKQRIPLNGWGAGREEWRWITWRHLLSTNLISSTQPNDAPTTLANISNAPIGDGYLQCVDSETSAEFDMFIRNKLGEICGPNHSQLQNMDLNAPFYSKEPLLESCHLVLQIICWQISLHVEDLGEIQNARVPQTGTHEYDWNDDSFLRHQTNPWKHIQNSLSLLCWFSRISW
jgi:hypothetical protein